MISKMMEISLFKKYKLFELIIHSKVIKSHCLKFKFLKLTYQTSQKNLIYLKKLVQNKKLA